MKGIILAGGTGTRLSPMTKIVTKQLLPIYDKPMIYYPLSLLMLCNIKEILIITTPRDIPSFQGLLGDGGHLGISIEYKIQERPRGISDAFLVGEDFIKNDDVMLILGDNLFYGDYSPFRMAIKKKALLTQEGVSSAHIFAYAVSDPERYGVVEFDGQTQKVISIEEKPSSPKSSFAVPGLYVFDKTVVERAKNLKPSPRGELEITDLIQTYLDENQLYVQKINRGMAWLDTGTPKSLLEACQFVAAIEERQGLKVACLEEVAFRMNMIGEEGLQNIINSYPKSNYREYLVSILKEVFSQPHVYPSDPTLRRIENTI